MFLILRIPASILWVPVFKRILTTKTNQKHGYSYIHTLER